LRFSVSWF